MEWIKSNLLHLNTTTKNLTKIILITSAMLLSSCKDNPVKDHNHTTIEKTKDQTISYEPNTEELWITSKYIITLTQNSNDRYSISTSDINKNDINITTLQNYCHKNDINNILINEDNKIEIVEAIVGMERKNQLLEEWKEEIWLYVFNIMNKSDTKNILNACFDNDYNDIETEIITDNIKGKNDTITNQNNLSIEDQYLLAEKKQNDSTLTEKERKKRSEIYNRLSTEIFQPSQDEITSTY